MSLRALFPFACLAVIAGCQPSGQNSNAPVPPEEVAEATAPDRSGRDPQAPDSYQVLFETTKGEVVIEIDRSLAPRGADRFHRLVSEGFFDGARFFRVLPGFVAQFGLNGDPAVNAQWKDAVIPDDRVRGSNTPGTVTFATSGPNSRTTQLFINLGNNTSLDGMGFAPIGKVIKGMEAVEQFYNGYGEGPPGGNGPNQQRITFEGNAYLDQEFPELDAIKTARVISENGDPVVEESSPEPETPAEE